MKTGKKNQSGLPLKGMFQRGGFLFLKLIMKNAKNVGFVRITAQKELYSKSMTYPGLNMPGVKVAVFAHMSAHSKLLRW